MILKYFITPVIASVIGYGTNYVAVKMLFHPRKEVKFLGKTLPFTPGAIPKGQPRLAKAVGDVVGNTLITKEDITEKLLDGKIENAVIEKISETLDTELKQEIMKLSKIDEDKYADMKNKITDTATNKIMDAVLDFQIGKVISADTRISENVYGLYLEAGGNYNGDMSAIKDNLESDVRKESEEMAGAGKRVSRSIWQRIETGF